MPRNTKTITISLPPDLSQRVESAVLQVEKTRSEFVRDALIRHLDYCEWKNLLEYGERTARAQEISADDVLTLVAEYRAEIGETP
jgi:metal-responsive CopG/Arc/MetJ family transcriptional regulator